MSISRASARSDVPVFQVMEVLAAAAARQRSHGDALLLCAGQPSTPAPRPARQAAAAAVEAEVLGYTEAVGTLALRTAIADHHRRDGLDVTADDVVVTTGSSGGFVALFLAAFDPGDRVVLPRPGYPAYRNTLRALGCEVVELACGPDQRYQPTVAQLDALPEPPAGLILASPANPTGTVIDAAELARIASWCAAHDCLLISDEIYHGIVFPDSPPSVSAWQVAPRSSVVVGSVSKYFSMTGWRVGWMLVPEHLRRPLDVLVGNLAICPPAVSQVAAVAALSTAARDELDGHVRRYVANRDLLLARLPALGIASFAPPDGAFYLWCDVSHLTDDSTRWCADVLAATGVALTPGADFDLVDGQRFVRLCFAGTAGELHEACDRLAAWLAR